MSLEKAIDRLTKVIKAVKTPIQTTTKVATTEFNPFGQYVGPCPMRNGYFDPASMKAGQCCYSTQPDGNCQYQCKDSKGMIGNVKHVSGPCEKEGLFESTWGG